jgi:hypothetical protein
MTLTPKQVETREFQWNTAIFTVAPLASGCPLQNQGLHLEETKWGFPAIVLSNRRFTDENK